MAIYRVYKRSNGTYDISAVLAERRSVKLVLTAEGLDGHEVPSAVEKLSAGIAERREVLGLTQGKTSVPGVTG